MRRCLAFVLRILLAHCVWTGVVWAQAGSITGTPAWYRVRNWRQADGLPQNMVITLLQATDGYLWIGTRGGLARFDGMSFTTYRELKEPEIWALVEGADQSIWAGTYSGGVARYHRGEFTFFTATEGLLNNFVTALCRDVEGNIWIGTEEGISCYRTREKRFLNYAAAQDKAPANIRALYAERDGSVWAASTRGELSRFNGDRFAPQRYDGPEPTTEVRAILRDSEGVLWLAARDGTYAIRDMSSRRYGPGDGLTNERAFRVHEDRKGTLWVATGAGLCRYVRGSDRFVPAAPQPDDQPVFAICEDAEGSLWLGYRNRGLARVHQGAFVSYTRQDGLVDDNVSAVVQDRAGTIWLGSSQGVQSFDGRTFTAYGPAAGVPETLTVALATDRAGHVWFGTARALYRSKTPATDTASPREFVQVSDPAVAVMHVRSIFEEEPGRIWVATDSDGLYLYRDGRFTRFATEQGLPDNTIRGLCASPGGGLLVGTTEGLVRLHDGKVTRLGEKDGLLSKFIQELYLDRSGAVWIGTRRGVTRYKNGRFTNLGPLHGLHASFVYGFAEDDHGNLWMQSSNGIFRIRLRQFEEFALSRTTMVDSFAYGLEHGIVSTSGPAGHYPVMMRARDGRLWFAMLGGLSTVDPAGLTTNARPPPVHLERLLIDGRTYPPSAVPDVEPGRGDLEFGYTALSYLAPEKVRFKYRLIGYDPDWVDAGNRRVAFYSNIPAGDYTFRVIAANNDGVWNTVGAARQLRLRPHFYETSWFYASCALGFILTAVGIHYRRTSQLRANERMLAQVVDTRTKDLQNEINERTRAELELRRYKDHLEEQVAARTNAWQQSREMLQSVIDSVPAHIFMKDLQGRFLFVNRQYAEQCGTTRDAMVGKTVYDFFPKEKADTFVARDVQALSTVKPVESEDQFTLADGAVHTFLATKCALRNAAGQPYAICGISSDITHVKLIEEQLRQSQKMEAIGRLAGGIAHDFNNLLTAINGYSSMALAHIDANHELHEPMREILKAGERAGSLTRQLLAYSRKQLLMPKRWDLNVIAADMEGLLTRIVGEDIAVETVLAPDAGPVMVDRGQVEQIILNLVVNARDAMPNGGRVLLETANVILDQQYAVVHREVVPGAYVMLAVTDSGHGMTAAVKARLFEPFFTTKELGKGTGLGLSVVYGIVKQSGGTISVYSEVGRGTTFRVYFPRLHESASGPDTEMPAKVGAHFGVESLLLVEDEEFVRTFARNALEASGYQVTAVANGREAVEQLERAGAKFDLVITDTVMPRMGGKELGDEVRRRWPGLSVLYMSGYTEKVMFPPGAGDPEEQFLQKPFGPSELTRKVRTLLNRNVRH